MSKRKPLPYASSYLVDEAIMALTEARREPRAALERSQGLEAAVKIGFGLDRINSALAALHSVKQIREE